MKNVNSIAAPDAAEILHEVLHDPLSAESKEPRRAWLDFLRSDLGLLSFQTGAYRELHPETSAMQISDTTQTVITDAPAARPLTPWPESLPTLYPLQEWVDSILTDEELSLTRVNWLTPLEHWIDVQRVALAEQGDAEAPTWQSARPLFPAVFPRFDARFVALELDATGWGPDDGDYRSPYEELGLRYMECVERWVAGRDKVERAKWKDEIDSFRRRVASRLGVQVDGNRPDGPREDILTAFVTQGEALFEVLWERLPGTVSESGTQVLHQYGVESVEQQQLWCARSALPILSHAEVLALLNDIAEARKWRRGSGSKPNPMRFAVWVVARRFGMRAASVAERTNPGSGTSYFTRKNPITLALGTAREQRPDHMTLVRQSLMEIRKAHRA